MFNNGIPPPNDRTVGKSGDSGKFNWSETNDHSLWYFLSCVFFFGIVALMRGC